ncbi:putative colanic acid biosynthesis acetyltransferase [Paraburkholderia lacunae]|uniref:Putative colanic acid biosynthesis acetyltransferase n=1 Tax=Paraburkholderia lacunae TaxID=2211104 RepID=A0A370MZ79_9BURK|nr:putative colanic acid biosynthesis acetyltransferase [Paraburkholderia lacunae]RDJ98642.1 putative colanic acid biosynthesis acetyltransferase [Paraburkholderia lacunae]
MGNVADDPQIGRMPEVPDVPDAPAAPDVNGVRENGRVIDLSLAGKGNYRAKRGILIELIWFVVEACVINNKLLPLSFIRVALLRLFGAKIGTGCRFVHPLRVKAPWNLEVGENCWFGVDVWIYNQAMIRIGSNVCISQGTLLSAGSHDMRSTMDLRVAPIVIEDGVWITSKCVVQMGVTIGRSAVVTPLSVVHRSLAPGGVYGGNPCRFIRNRFDSVA